MTPPVNSLNVLIKYISIVYSKIVLEVNGLVHRTKTYHRRDNAPDPLFSWVDEAVLRRPTYHTFIKLLDNYEAGTGQAEVVTREEEQENWAFINACMTTKVCTLHVYC